MTEFFIHMHPPTTTDQQHRIGKTKKGKVVVYDSDELKAAKAKLEAHLAQHVPKEMYTCGVRVTTRWCFFSDSHRDGEYKITKPDTGNLNKALFDIMTKLCFWTDDCLVASGLEEKFWSKRPGLYVKIEKLGE